MKPKYHLVQSKIVAIFLVVSSCGFALLNNYCEFYFFVLQILIRNEKIFLATNKVNIIFGSSSDIYFPY